jgi:hypothetical protein
MTLHFTHAGKDYSVNQAGQIKANGLTEHSPTWLFLGGSRHHWRNGIDVTLKEAFDFPGMLNGCIGWDIYHGTTRKWGGRYYGRLPRINNAVVWA